MCRVSKLVSTINMGSKEPYQVGIAMYHLVHPFHTRYNVLYTYYIPTHIPSGYIVYMPVSYQPRFEKYPVYEELAGMKTWKYSTLGPNRYVQKSILRSWYENFLSVVGVTPRGAGSSGNNCPQPPRRVVILGNSRLRATINHTCKFF